MKTVSGVVLSSKPISLSKATSFYSLFVSSDTGASGEFGVYLRRVLASLKEQKQFHEELRGPRSHRRPSRHRSETGNDQVETVAENPTQNGNSNRVVPAVGIERERKQKKGEFRNLGEDGGESAERAGEVVEKREATDSVEAHKEKKKKMTENVANSDEMGFNGEVQMYNKEVKKEKRMKRKSGVLEDGDSDALEEQRGNKKKRMKI